MENRMLEYQQCIDEGLRDLRASVLQLKALCGSSPDDLFFGCTDEDRGRALDNVLSAIWQYSGDVSVSWRYLVPYLSLEIQGQAS